MKIPTAQANKIIMFVALSSVVQSVTLAIILHAIKVMSLTEGVLAGLLLWFGLVTASIVGVTLYSKRSWGFLWLNSAYFLVAVSLGSIVFALWR